MHAFGDTDFSFMGKCSELNESGTVISFNVFSIRTSVFGELPYHSSPESSHSLFSLMESKKTEHIGWDSSFIKMYCSNRNIQS